MKRLLPVLLVCIVGMATASLHAQYGESTAPVGGDLAEWERLNAESSIEEMERHRVRSLDEIKGADWREKMNERANALRLEKQREADARVARLQMQSEELIFPLSWTHEETGSISRLVGEDDRGIPRMVRTFGEYQMFQSGILDLQDLGPYGGDFKEVGFWELGLPRTTHEDFEDLSTSNSRMAIAPGQSASMSDHATAVGGVLIGAGLGVNQSTGDTSLGAAFEGVAIAWDQDNEFPEMLGLAEDELFVHNHSYGLAAGWWWGNLGGTIYNVKQWVGDIDDSTEESRFFGAYNSLSVDVDDLVRARRFTLPVWAAGNDTGLGPPDLISRFGTEWLDVYHDGVFHSDGYYLTWYEDQVGFHNGEYFWPGTAVDSINPFFPEIDMLASASPVAVIGFPDVDGGANGFNTIPHGYGVAKNALTVGSLGNWTGSISSFSARGPVNDGRVKPDVVTVGEDVYTAHGASDISYVSASGTSFSAPAATGGIHLLSEHQEALWGNADPLRASSYRALVAHTAQDLGNSGPNYTYGWGAIQIDDAAGVIENNFFSGQRTYLKEIVVPDEGVVSFTIRSAGGGPIKVTTAWTDPAGEAQPDELHPEHFALVNNLDMVLYELDSGGDPVSGPYFPWTLNPGVPFFPAVQTEPNDIDNIIQVRTPTSVPQNTIYLVEIKQRDGTTIVGDDGITPSYQPVSIVLSGVVNRNIPFQVTNQHLDFSGGHVVATLTWGSHAGKYYAIEHTEDLNNPDWTIVSPTFNANADQATGSTDPIPIGPSAFFRVVVVPPDPFGYL